MYKDIYINILKSLAYFGLIIDRISKTVQNKRKKTGCEFLGMLLETIEASMLGNTIAKNCIMRPNEGVMRTQQGVMRAKKGVLRARTISNIYHMVRRFLILYHFLSNIEIINNSIMNPTLMVFIQDTIYLK